MKLLVVEDEKKLAGNLKRGLEEQNYEVDLAYDGDIGYRLAFKNNYDAIVLDIILPGLNGFEVSRKLRENNINTPIIMLTAMGATDDKLTGFDAGTDDYLVKPFEFAELLARIKSLIKRSKQEVTLGNVLKIADLELNCDSKQVTRANQKIDLTPKEFALLEYMLRNKGKVVSRAFIAENVWDINFDTGTNVVDVYVNFLRKKINFFVFF